MSVKLLTEHHLEFPSLKGDCTGSSESTHVKMPDCWKSHVAAHIYLNFCDLSSTAISSILFFPLPVYSSNHPGTRKYTSHCDLLALSSWFNSHTEILSAFQLQQMKMFATLRNCENNVKSMSIEVQTPSNPCDKKLCIHWDSKIQAMKFQKI